MSRVTHIAQIYCSNVFISQLEITLKDFFLLALFVQRQEEFNK